MPTLGGPGVHGKIIKIRPYNDEGSETLLPLTDRQRGILLAMTEYLDWKSRWETFPPPLDNDSDRIDYVAELKNRLMIIMNICEQMIVCIEGDEDVINTLIQFMLNQIQTNPEIRSALQEAIQQNVGEDNHLSQPDDNMVYGKTGCDEDNLFGAIRFFVKWMHQNNVDFLERLSDGITPESINDVMSQLFPGFQGDGLIAETLVGAFAKLSGAILTAYNANYDTVYEDALICELFCLAQPTCSLSVAAVYSVFSVRLSAPIDGFDVFGNALSFVTQGTFGSAAYVDAMFFLQIGSFVFLNGFNNFRGVSPLVSAVNQGWDDPSDDWTECDDCPGEWCRYIDKDSGLDTLFSYLDNGHGPQAHWSGTGWEADIEGIQSRISIAWTDATARNIIDITVHNTLPIDNGDTNNKTIYGPTTAYGPLPGATEESVFDMNVVIGTFTIDEVSDGSISSTNLVPGEIDWIKIRGVGTVPSFGVECE